ncbi:hypothetical protein AGMMS49982_05060 [Bacteroidia bacterium]|nr:hypothetical protein AGMMS49982_05060 [Bacteroidia bacterium]
MATDTGEIHIGQRIQQSLKDKKLSIAWLAEKVNCDRSNFYKILKCKDIHSRLLYQISIALEEDFFAVYSQKIAEKIAST